MPDADHQDTGLDALLRRAGSRFDAAGVRDLVSGVVAAPDGIDPDAWMTLVAAAPDGDLRRALADLHDDLAARRPPVLAATGDQRADRLTALQGELKRRRLHGFIVPRGDEHLGEYVPERAERLAWLTGFTGSAGVAVVLRDTAALFTDGRYTLQAEAEVDGDLLDIRHSTEQPTTEWIAANLPARARLGYDPWLHTPNDVTRYETACVRAGGRLAAVADNPVDAVWADQPPPPVAPIVAHAAEFAGRAAADKRQDVAEALTRDRHDAAVLVAPESVAWLLNLRGGDVPYAPLPLSFAIAAADGSVWLFVDGRKLADDVADHLGPAVTVHPPEALGEALDGLGTHRATVRVDSDGTPAWIADRLRKAGARVATGPDPCARPRAVKNPVELDGMRAAHRRDGAALSRFLAWLPGAIDGGVTEIDAARHLEDLRREGDLFRGLSFPTISGFAANGAVIHYRVSPSTNRVLEPGSLYLVDSGGQYLDGTTDVTRTVAIGAPTDEMRDRFTRVLKGHIAMATARFPAGTAGPQLDVLARRALWDAGLDYDHGTGHGVGSYLSVHEGPHRISKLPNRVALEPGMVVSNEPGYYKAGAYGIRIENLVVVTAVDAPEGSEKDLLGFDTLTLAPIDRDLIAPALLTAAEVAWLDAYHARVRETLTPLVDAGTAAWLDRATRPLGG